MLSFPEILVILLVAVIVLGPKRLPETARKLGRWVGLCKQFAEEFKQQIMTMDQMANQALNHATQDLDAIKPEEVAAYEQIETELVRTMQAAYEAPPMRTPDDDLAQPPVPGGLPSEPSSTIASDAAASLAERALPPKEVVASSNSSESPVTKATPEVAPSKGEEAQA